MRYQSFFAAVMAAAAVAASAGSSSAGTTSDKAANVAQDVKTGVTDSWLTAKTKIALFADERVKGSQVAVETVNGTTMLRGKVDSPEAKAAAESIAKGIDGVAAVKNDLQVVPPSARPMVDANDKDLKKAVENKFARDPGINSLDVRADAGVVTLTGKVPDIAASARASELARGVPGVRAVKNEVTFKDDRGADRSQRPAHRVATGSATSDRTGPQQHVRVTQQALKDRGYDPGVVDGVQGPRTTAALVAFQKAESIPETGRADAQTLGKLGIGVGGPRAQRPVSPRK